MERLRAALAFGGILNHQELDELLAHFQACPLAPNDYFLEIGQVSDEIAFIDEGILRCFTYGLEGEDVTKYFLRQNQFVVDLESYYNNTGADSALQAVNSCLLYKVHRSTWQHLTERFPRAFLLTKSLTEASLLNKIKDNDFLNFGRSKDKYKAFVHRYPDLATQVPQQYIASYLKITPQSLSRIRRELAG